MVPQRVGVVALLGMGIRVVPLVVIHCFVDMQVNSQSVMLMYVVGKVVPQLIHTYV